jgi:hypothetical protein
MNNTYTPPNEDAELSELNQGFFVPGPNDEGLEEGEMLFPNQGVDPNETIEIPPTKRVNNSINSSNKESNGYVSNGGRRRRTYRKSKNAKKVKKSRKSHTRKSRKSSRRSRRR